MVIKEKYTIEIGELSIDVTRQELEQLRVELARVLPNEAWSNPWPTWTGPGYITNPCVTITSTANSNKVALDGGSEV